MIQISSCYCGQSAEYISQYGRKLLEKPTILRACPDPAPLAFDSGPGLGGLRAGVVLAVASSAAA